MGMCMSIDIENDSSENVLSAYPEGTIALVQGLGSLYSKPGSIGLNQDAAILYQGYGREDGTFCGVFDGHGENGDVVSKIVMNRLPSLLLSQRSTLKNISTAAAYEGNLQNERETMDGAFVPNRSFQKWQEACIRAFKVMDTEIRLRENLDCSTSGTTALIVIRQGEDLIIANLGDSRALLGTVTENGVMGVQLTTDLKPSLPKEADRIRLCNGRVLASKEEPHIQRVWLPHAAMPGLTMSRAFGHFQLKDYGIIAIPQISYHRLSSTDQFLVLATDRVWNVLSNDQVASIVWSSKSEEAAAKAVVDAANATWRHKLPSSKVDDCTVVCLFFHQRQNLYLSSP